MTKANECTCPSGDGSLRHPCPAHPAAEQAGGDERAAFELFVRKHCGMPEHIAVNWDAKFTNDAWEGWKARAALAQPSQAIAAAPTYQFQSREIGESDWAPCDFRWYLYCSKSPEMDTRVVEVAAQPSPAQAGANVGHGHVFPRADGVKMRCGGPGLCPECSADASRARTALAQHSPASDLDPLNLAPHAEAFNEAPAEALKPEQAEAERPEVVAWQYRVTAGPQTGWSLWHPGKGEEFERSYTVERRPLMTVAQAQHSVPEGFRELLEMLVVSDLRKIRYAGAWRREVHDRASSILALLAAAPGKEEV